VRLTRRLEDLKEKAAKHGHVFLLPQHVIHSRGKREGGGKSGTRRAYHGQHKKGAVVLFLMIGPDEERREERCRQTAQRRERRTQPCYIPYSLRVVTEGKRKKKGSICFFSEGEREIRGFSLICGCPRQ